MPALKKAKYELFAQELAKGATVSDAEVAAGLKLIPAVGLKGYYVYLLIDPRSDAVFYVGKGKNRRSAGHMKEWRSGRTPNSAKFDRISEIIHAGEQVTERCLAHELTEPQALDLELFVIRTIGIENLTNLLRGQESAEAKCAAVAMDFLRRLVPQPEWEKRRFNAGANLSAEKPVYYEIVSALVEVARAGTA